MKKMESQEIGNKATGLNKEIEGYLKKLGLVE